MPDSGWERHFYEMALNGGVHEVLACFFGTLMLKLTDTAAICCLMPLLLWRKGRK